MKSYNLSFGEPRGNVAVTEHLDSYMEQKTVNLRVWMHSGRANWRLYSCWGQKVAIVCTRKKNLLKWMVMPQVMENDWGKCCSQLKSTQCSWVPALSCYANKGVFVDIAPQQNSPWTVAQTQKFRLLKKKVCDVKSGTYSLVSATIM